MKDYLSTFCCEVAIATSGFSSRDSLLSSKLTPVLPLPAHGESFFNLFLFF